MPAEEMTMVKHIYTCGRYLLVKVTRFSGKQMIACCALLFSFSYLAEAQRVPEDGRDSVRALDAIIVNDVKVSNKTPLTTSTMNRDVLQEARSEVTIPYMIETLPSVVTTGENGAVGGTTLRIRGVDPSRINVNINGITLNDPESQQVFWYNIPNLGGMAQSLQIQRGVGASTGGSAAFGAAINLQTVNASGKPYGVADFGLGSWNTRQYSISAGTGILKSGISFDFAYSGLTSEGYVRSWGTDQQSFFGNLSWYGENTLVKLLAIIGSQTTGITWNGAYEAELDADPHYNSAGAFDLDGNTVYYPNETDNYWQQHYQLYVSHLFNDNWSLKAAFDFTHGDGYYEQYMTAFSMYNPSPYYGLSDVVFRKQMDNNSFTANRAINYTSDAFSLSLGDNIVVYDGDQFGNVIWVRDTSLHANLPNRWYDNNSRKTDNSVYAKATYDFNTNFNIYADVQLRTIDYRIHGNSDDVLDGTPLQGPFDFTHTYTFFNPKVGANYRFNSHSRTYFVMGISNREPVRFDIMNAYANNKEIKSERMIDIEWGFQEAQPRWSYNYNLYAMIYKNQMTPNGDVLTGYSLMENVKKSYRIGVELEGGYRFFDWFRMDANLTISSNRVIDNTYSDFADGDTVATTVTSNTDLALSPSVVGAAIATFSPFKNAKLQLIGKYVGKQYADNTSRECYAIDPYFLLNVKASYTWHLRGSQEIEAQMVVNNVFDYRFRLNAWAGDWTDDWTTPGTTYYYHDRTYLQQPGTNFMCRLIYRF